MCTTPLQDTKTPTINSLLAIVLNIVINLLLMRTMEHKGAGAGDGAFQLYYHRAADHSSCSARWGIWATGTWRGPT